MSKRRAKHKTKRKPNEVIRTDIWDLKATSEQKAQMLGNIEEYRKFLNPLVLLFITHLNYYHQKKLFVNQK